MQPSEVPLSPEANRRLRATEYGESFLYDTMIREPFVAPFEHLNFLGDVIKTDCSAIFAETIEQITGMDIFSSMTTYWASIEHYAKHTGYDVFGAIGEVPLLVHDIRPLRRVLAIVEACGWKSLNSREWAYGHAIPKILHDDYFFIIKRDQEYYASWLKRGGVGAFMMLARKWDRFAPMVEEFHGVVHEMLKAKPDRIDDVQDLRRYLMLVESEWNRRLYIANEGSLQRPLFNA